MENIGPKRGEVTGDRKRLRNGVLYDLYCSPDVICSIKFRRMMWVLRVVCVCDGEERCVRGFGGGGTCQKESTWKT